MKLSRMSSVPAQRFFPLITVAVAIGLAGCQRSQPLPEDQTQKLIEPVAKVEVAPAAAAAPAAAPARRRRPLPRRRDT